MSIIFLKAILDMVGSSLKAGKSLPTNMDTVEIFYHAAHVCNQTNATHGAPFPSFLFTRDDTGVTDRNAVRRDRDK